MGKLKPIPPFPAGCEIKVFAMSFFIPHKIRPCTPMEYTEWRKTENARIPHAILAETIALFRIFDRETTALVVCHGYGTRILKLSILSFEWIFFKRRILRKIQSKKKEEREKARKKFSTFTIWITIWIRVHECSIDRRESCLQPETFLKRLFTERGVDSINNEKNEA